MSTYKRGNVWWYEVVFRGQRIRESSDSENHEAAIRIERERRRKLELAGDERGSLERQQSAD